MTATSADVIIVADAGLSEANLLDVVRQPACHQCDIMIVPWMQQFYAHGLFIDHIGAIPVMRIRKPGLTGPAWVVKRMADILVSTILLLLLLPVLAPAPSRSGLRADPACCSARSGSGATASCSPA